MNNSRPPPHVDLARRGRNVVMTLTYESELAAKHASDAMATSLVTTGAGIVTTGPKPCARLSKNEKVFASVWCSANTATAMVVALTACNSITFLASVLLLVVNLIMLLVAAA